MPADELYRCLNEYCKFKEYEYDNNPFSTWSEQKLGDFINEVFLRIHTSNQSSNSFYNFSANSTLSGGPFPCESFDCRINNVDNLIRFAAFYADKVLIKSPIDKHYNKLKQNKKIDRHALYIDILILLRLKPLIEAEIIGFTSEYVCLCENCIHKYISNEAEFNRKIGILEDDLITDCLNQITCTLQNTYGYPYICVEGAEKYGYHHKNDIIFTEYIPKPIKELQQKYSAKKFVLPKNTVKDLGIVEHILNPSIQDLLESNIYCTNTGFSYLTNKDFDVQMINLLHDSRNLELSSTLSSGLFHTVPLLANVKVDDVVKLRCKDGESFKVYRDSVNKVLSSNSKLDFKQLRDIQRDVIVPEIDKIELTIKNNRKALLGSLAYDLVFWGASISIGIFSGLLPFKVTPIISAVGGLTTLKNTIGKAKSTIMSNSEIRNSNYYFLWRLIKDKKST